ncbi:MAG TPA: AAA family ATPase, partial [Thermoplasmata archaeon]|nr:AAA family ATPase [Thermoplasmata archaeon]
MRFCLIVRGPLGVGKTTVSEALAKLLHARVVSIDQILERHNLEEWEDGYISVGSFLRANDFALEEAGPHLRQDIPVIVDGNFYHRAAIDDLLARVHVPHAVVTLVAS